MLNSTAFRNNAMKGNRITSKVLSWRSGGIGGVSLGLARAGSVRPISLPRIKANESKSVRISAVFRSGYSARPLSPSSILGSPRDTCGKDFELMEAGNTFIQNIGYGTLMSVMKPTTRQPD